MIRRSSAILFLPAFLLTATEKRRRDAVYLSRGICMIVGVVWAATSLITNAPIFWPETVAIVAFAISWLVKGEADHPVRRAIGALWSPGAPKA
jgi:hypothetical protein